MSDYRAKRVDGRGWEYGWRVRADNKHFIVKLNAPVLDYGFKEIKGLVEVIPETVELCSSVEDKHRKRVYQGDIVRCWKLQDTMHPKGLDYGTAGMVEGYAMAVVEFDGWEFSFKQLSGSDGFFEEPDGRSFDPHCTRTRPTQEYEWMEIIGNTTDDPELMEIEK